MKTSTKRILFYVPSGLIILVLLGMAFPISCNSHVGWRGNLVMNEVSARQLHLGLELYKNDHGGNLPPTLRDMVGHWLSSEDVDHLRFSDRRRRHYDWIYDPTCQDGYLLRAPKPIKGWVIIITCDGQSKRVAEDELPPLPKP